MNQRRAYLLREVKHESWETIAGKVVNLQGEHPCWGTVRNIVSEFDVSRGHRQYHQEKLQCKVERSVTFAETPSGGYAHRKWLWKVPIVVTANFSTMNQQLLHTDDVLSHHENRVVVRRQAGVI